MVGPPIIGSVIGNLVGEKVGERTTKEMGLDKAAGQVSSLACQFQDADYVLTLVTKPNSLQM
jgi:hypothetical protein